MKIQFKAEDFFNAYLILKANNEAFIDSQAKNPSSSLKKIKTIGAHPAMGVDIVCLAFSVELYIKDLHYAIKGKTPRGHNILKLFEGLPKHIRQVIFAHDSISQNPFITRGDIFSVNRFNDTYTAYDRFVDQIKSISDGFEKWRYSYESGSLHYDVSFALVFIEVIKSVAGKVRNDQL